jgi:hypothetical protein
MLYTSFLSLSATDFQHARPMELLRGNTVRRRRGQEDDKATQTALLHEEMLASAEGPRSASVHVRAVRQRQLLGRGLLREEKLQDPQRRRRRGGGQDHEEECRGRDGAAGRRRVQPRGPAGRGLRHGHGVRRCPGPDLLAAVHAQDLLLARP